MAGGSRWLRLAIYALFAAILYLPGLGKPPLWEPDEGRYAEIAREMVISGDFVTPRDNWVRYFEKPPLIYWAEAGAIKMLGASEFAIRMPAALCTIGEVVVTAGLAEAMFGVSAGLLAAIALATSPIVFGFGRFATLDPPLALFLTAAIGAFYLASRFEDFAGGTGRRWFIASAAMLALGTLAKGPVALFLGGAIALIWILIEGRANEIPRMPWLWGIAVFCAIAIPWFALAESRNPGFLRFFFIHEHLQRYVESREHANSLFFFVPIVIAGAWPWLFFVPAAVSQSQEFSETRSNIRLLVIWFLVIFIFFSIPSSKLGGYILPAIAPIAIAAGYALACLPSFQSARRIRILGSFAIVNLIASAAAIVTLTISRRLEPGIESTGIAIAIAIGGGAMAAYLLAIRNPSPFAVAGPLLVAMLITASMIGRLRVEAGSHFTYRELGRAMRPYVADGCAIGSYRHFVQALPFYSGGREILVEYRGELEPFSGDPGADGYFIRNQRELETVWNSNRCVVLIVNRNDLDSLTRALSPSPSMIACEGKKFAISNRPSKTPLVMGNCESRLQPD
ncbi:MAG TPA: phospholipid carrier-dependent glycosyltransferase [Candidatus Binataceae bacterium]